VKSGIFFLMEGKFRISLRTRKRVEKMKTKMHSRNVAVLLFLSSLLVICVGTAQVVNPQINPQIKQLPQRTQIQLPAPQIIMQRAALEPARGMNIYETRVLQVPLRSSRILPNRKDLS